MDTFGHRLSGSASLEAAIDWILSEMKADGLQNVRGERAMVPHWVRGAESADLIKPRAAPLRMLGLGGSIATPKNGITAPVLVVNSFDDLRSRASEAKGKIVLFDAPFTSYRETVHYRVEGASAAARVGAVACLIRSVASFSIRSPHTGVMHYDSTVARIPTAALSVEDAEMLHRFQDRGQPVVVRLRMAARTLPDVPSRNVVAEVTGRERPDEVVVLGGHIDSWDVGQGAMDDGGGAVAAWQAVRLIHRLGLHPRRTIRVVLWTNEENGGKGALAYRDAHAGQLRPACARDGVGQRRIHPSRLSLHRLRRGARSSAASRGPAAADRGDQRVPGKGLAGGGHRSAGRTGGSWSRSGCGSDPLLLVPSQRR